MKARRLFIASWIVLVLTSLLFSSVSAASVTSSGVTLNYPSYPLTGPGYQTCEPWEEPSLNTISLDGIPEGASVQVNFVYSNPYSGSPTYLPALNYQNVSGGSLVVPVSYPMDTTSWPVFNTATNERAIAVAVFVRINSGTTTTKLVSKQWWVRCVPPMQPYQGCTPGYWRQDQHFDSWVATGYAPGDDFEVVFGVDASFDPHTLLDAVWASGGGEFALARHATAALLNASNPAVNYLFTPQQIIDGVQAAYASGDFEAFKDDLDFANNAGCPLN